MRYLDASGTVRLIKLVRRVLMNDRLRLRMVASFTETRPSSWIIEIGMPSRHSEWTLRNKLIQLPVELDEDSVFIFDNHREEIRQALKDAKLKVLMPGKS
tara:strand:- start:1027 stop:1326 length:300 start_codon:yes stop_codon:yes gene_type:complete